MGAVVKIGGVTKWDAFGVNVLHDITPLDPSDTFGGIGRVEFTIDAEGDAKALLGKGFELVDAVRGSVSGTVVALRGDHAKVIVQANPRMVALVADRTAAPHVGTLETYLTYLFGLCGIDTGIDIDPAVADYDVVAIGFRDDVWGQLKKFCAAYQVEIALVGGNVTVRPPRQVRVTTRDRSGFAWALDQSRLAKTVEAWFYPVQAVTDALVLGVGDIHPVANIAAGEVHEFDISLPFSLSSVDQPVASSSVAYDDAASSTYSVLDAFDEPVPPSKWAAGGGRVTVRIADDTRGLRVTVVGSNETVGAPYRLTGVTNMGVEYSTLRVVGSGVAFGREKYSLSACDDSRATIEVGAEVDNQYLTSWGHAHLALLPAVRRHGGGLKTITGSSPISGEFGTIAGARLRDDFDEYRIRSITTSPPADAHAWIAESDTTVADVDAVWAGHTIGEWDDRWAGRPLVEFDLRPLTPLEGDPVIPTGLFPGLDTFPSSTTFPGA